jgi:hypothetical protein
MRDIISKSWCKKLAGPEGQRDRKGGQGVRREAESEGPAEKYRAVIEGRHPKDELVGRGWGKVEPAIGRRRRSHSPTRYKVIAGGTVQKNGV